MNYLKSLFFNFLTVFFADHLLPGLSIMSLTRLPHLGADFIVALSLGLLNSLIYPVLKMLKQEISALKIALIALVLNFGAYALIKILPAGIQIHTVEGYILVSVIVALVGFLTNYFEMKAAKKHHYEPPPPG